MISAPATNREVTHHVAQRLVGIVSEAHPPLDSDLKVTMLAGFVCCPDYEESVSSLFGLADRALAGQGRWTESRMRTSGRLLTGSENGHSQRWRHARVEVEAILTVDDHVFLLCTCLRVILALLALNNYELVISRFCFQFQEMI